MAITATYGPIGFLPDFAKGESQWGYLVGAGTETVFNGKGRLKYVDVLVAGTNVSIHDANSTDTPTAANRIAQFSSVAIGRKFEPQTVDLQRGLTIVTTGAATELYVGFNGRPSVSPLTFGTQLDGNAGRPSGTSSDRVVPD